MDIEEKMIGQIEANPESRIKRALYAEWLDVKCRRAEIIRRDIGEDAEHLIRENDRA